MGILSARWGHGPWSSAPPLSRALPAPVHSDSTVRRVWQASFRSTTNDDLLSHMAVHHLHHLHYHRLHLLLLAQYFILNSRVYGGKDLLKSQVLTQDLALQQILSSIDLFLSYRIDCTDSNDFTLLNGWIGKCVRLSRFLFGFRMHFKITALSFIHSFPCAWASYSWHSAGGSTCDADRVGWIAENDSDGLRVYA